MQIIAILAAGLLSLTAMGCSSISPAIHNLPQRHAALRAELLAMADLDQRVREGISAQMGPDKVAQMQVVDAKHTARMKEIIAEHGWPGSSLVGDDGAHAAWLLVQHANASFMRECLPLMERAVSAGEASAKDYAYLLDRVRMNEGKPQVYGTQFVSSANGNLVLYPIENAELVDERRRSVGLPPMAEYEKKLREIYK